MSALRTRVEAAERLMGQVAVNANPLIIMGGLVADASGDIGFAAGQHFQRGGDETVEAFRLRISKLARASREQPILGGLPPMPTEGGP